MKASISELRAFLPPSQLAEEFDITIKAKRRKPDSRRLVKDPETLKAFVDALVARDIATLPPSQQALARAILRSMLVKPTVNSVIEAIAAYRGKLEQDWLDDRVKAGYIAAPKKEALRDNYYRPWKKGPRGQAPRTKRARHTALLEDE
jgi:hypothetical protein